MKVPNIEKVQAYLRATELASHEVPPIQLPAVTISRETGAGAVTIGNMLAEYLESRQSPPRRPWAVFDQNLVRRVLDEHGLPAHLQKYMPEDGTSPVREAVEEILGAHPSNWSLIHYTTDTIYRLACAGNVIIIGRAGNIIASNLRHVLRVRLVAPFETRVRHAAVAFALSRKDAADFVLREDKARKRYVEQNFNSRVDDPLEYHLVLNTAALGFRETARLIGDAVLRLPLPAAARARAHSNRCQSLAGYQIIERNSP
jgi:cytidylate kinase